MFELKKSTSKQEFLDYLVAEAISDSPLKVIVISLPSFLDSSLAVNIFINQLRGYPRKLEWYTRSAEIFDILATSKLAIDSITFDPPKFEQSQGNYHNPDVVEVIEQTLLAGQKITSAPSLKSPTQNIEYSKMFAGPKVQEVQAPTPVPVVEKTVPVASNPAKQFVPTPTQLDTQNAGYQPLVVMHNGLPMDLPQPEPMLSDTAQPNLDAWLENIQKAKESIGAVKKNKNFFRNTDPATTLRDAFETDARKFVRKASVWSWVPRLAMAGAAAALVVGIWFGFGSSIFTPDVYTIKIKQDRKEQTLTLQATSADTKSITFDNRAESTITTTGKADTGTRSRGTVGLVNESNQSIALNNAGFYLQKSGVTYSVTENKSLPSVITIPGGTSGASFTYETTANIDGTGTGLAVGERLTLRNLAGSLISDKLYAVVLTEIKQPKQGAFVTQADIDALKKQNTDKNQLKITDKLKSLPTTQLALPELVTTEVIKETPNAKVDDTADSVTLQSDYKNTLMYFETSNLESILKQQVSTDRVDSLVLTKAEKSDTGYKLTLKAVYYLPQEFRDEELLTVIQNSNNTQNSESLLKTKFPTIQSIDQKKGFSFFSQKPVIRIENSN